MTNLDIICNHFQLLLIAVSVFFKQLFSLAFLQREKKKKKPDIQIQSTQVAAENSYVFGGQHQ